MQEIEHIETDPVLVEKRRADALAAMELNHDADFLDPDGQIRELLSRHPELRIDISRLPSLSYSDKRTLLFDMRRLVAGKADFVVVWQKKLADAIVAEIDQEIAIEIGRLDPHDAIDYRSQFVTEFKAACGTDYPRFWQSIKDEFDDRLHG
jgi:hypothetical protein